MTGVVTKRKEFSSVLILSKKKKSTSDPSSRPSAAWSKPLSILGWLLLIVNIPKYTLIAVPGTYLFEMEGGER